MATGIELVLGFGSLRIDRVLKGLGLYFCYGELDDGTPAVDGVKPWKRQHPTDSELAKLLDNAGNLQRETKCKEIDARLRGAHTAALIEAGFSGIKADKARGSVTARTPAGMREMSPFSLGMLYDPNEMGDTEETAVLGVSITSRYKPCFADYQSPHGGNDQFDLGSEELARMQQIAKKHIAAAVPVFAEATWHVKMLHY